MWFRHAFPKKVFHKTKHLMLQNNFPIFGLFISLQGIPKLSSNAIQFHMVGSLDIELAIIWRSPNQFIINSALT